MRLEDKIKALLSGNNIITEEELIESEELNEKVTVKGKDGEELTMDSDGDGKPDDEEDDEDNEKDDDDQTDVSKDTGKKDKVEVKEGTDLPGESKSISVGSDSGENGSTKTAKVKAGESKLDEPSGKVKLTDPSHADSQDDNGDNAKIQSGKKNKDEPGTSGGVKLSMKEHTNALFAGEQLTEEFKNKAETIFEAAVQQVVEARMEELKEGFDLQLEEAVENVKSVLVEQIDGYLDYVIEEWVKDNAVALESGIKSDLVESFIDGLKGLFREHYVDVPEQEINVVEEQNEVIGQLETEKVSLVEENASLKAQIATITKKAIFESVCVGLTVPQKQKFTSLVEKIEFVSEETYSEKLKTLKENYFSPKSSSNVITESNENTDTNVVDSNIEVYAKALNSPLKFVRNQ